MASLISVGQVVDQAIHHYRKQFKNLMSISLFLFAGLPFMLAGGVLFNADNVTRLLISGVCEVLGVVVTAVAGYWVFNGLVLATDLQNSNKNADAKMVNQAAWQKLAPAVAVSLLIALALIGTVLFLVPGAILFLVHGGNSFIVPALGALLIISGGFAAICTSAWLGVTYIFAPYSVLTEDRKPIDALRRAHELVRGRWLAVMLRVLIPKITILVIALFVQYAATIALSMLSAGLGQGALLPFVFLNDIVNIGFSVLVTPLFVIADYYVFQSLVDTKKGAA